MRGIRGRNRPRVGARGTDKGDRDSCQFPYPVSAKEASSREEEEPDEEKVKQAEEEEEKERIKQDGGSSLPSGKERAESL